MSRNEFDASLYIERDVDRALWNKLTQWVQGSQKTRWVSLDSRPGHGNTWLLDQIHYLTTNNTNFKLSVRVIQVKSGDADYDHPPKPLNPLATELFRIYSSGRLSPWRRLKLRLHHASSWQLTKVGLVVCAGFILSCLLGGFNEYVTSINSKLVYIHLWFPRFWSEYFIEHWTDFLIWFITGSTAGLPFSMAVLYMARNRILPRPADVTPADQDFEYLRTHRGLIYSLQEICEGWRKVLLLIDDAHCLPKTEKQFLYGLFNAASQDRDVQRFLEDHSVMIVSLDTQQDNWQELLPRHMQKQIETLVVPEFNLIELRDIARAQLQGRSGHVGMKDEEIENLLEQAQRHENVKILFAHLYNQLVEEMGEEFLKAKEKDIQSVFGLDEVMAYQAVRLEPSIEEKSLLGWLKSVSSSEHLAMFGMDPPDGVQQLMKDFLSDTSLVNKLGTICYFDTTRCRALQHWLKDHSPQLLAQSHYFWFWSSLKQVTNTRLKPDWVVSQKRDFQQTIKEGAWHATRIGYLLEKAPAVLAQASGLTDEQRLQCCYDVAASLLSSAAIWRSEGDISEADDLIIDAEEWLCNPDGEQREAWLECAAEQLWEDYWLSGDVTTRDQLRELADHFPQVIVKPCWIINQRLEELLQGKEVISNPPAEPPESSPAQCNLHRLVETLLDIRKSHGFIIAALRDPDLEIREPLVAQGDTLAEFYLRQLQAIAWIERGEIEALTETLAQWRTRLEETKPSSGHIGDEALHAYNEARYWHLLADVWTKNVGPVDNLPADKIEAALQNLRRYLTAACLRPPDDNAEVYDFVWREAQYAYERSLQIAALLGWRVIVLEISFHLGTLLQHHTPMDKRSESKSWWGGWDGQFSQCIELEKELGWFFHTPALHRIRWKFLEEDVSLEHCIEDAYNTLLAVQRAHYPNAMRLRFHNQVSTLLTNYSETEINRKRTAELYKMWAYQLAKLPEAAELWQFKCLPHEQAHNLGFAAQAQRLMQEFEEAERLLDEADALLVQAPSGEDEHVEDSMNLRDLELGLRIQRAWLREAQERKPEYHALIHDIWRDMRRDDRICINLLGSLLGVELEKQLLYDPWPPSPEVPIYEDPDNQNLSLPANWFIGDDPMEVNNRFEFRLYQLLSLSGVAKRPTLNLLLFLAWADWPRKSRFGETCIRFAQYGLKFEHDLSEDAKSLLVNLLKAVRFYFDKVEEVGRHELEVLLLLMEYEKDSVEFRVEYITALREHQYLLERELRVRQEAQDWFSVADRVDDYLGVLVDATLLASRAGMKLRQSGIPLEKVKELREWRKGVLAQAHAAYSSGNQAECLQRLTPALPAGTSPWVFLEDLQILNLWLQAAKASGAYQPDEFSQRATQLRKSALQYIHQFSEVINDVQIQSLALELFDKLQNSIVANGQENH